MKRIGSFLGLTFLMMSIQQEGFSDPNHPRYRDSAVHEIVYVTQNRDYGPYRREGHYFTKETYYSCPQGDFISDRPGRCPLDGSILVPRSVHYDHGESYHQRRY